MSNKPASKILLSVFIFFSSFSLNAGATTDFQALTDSYIKSWAEFYPSAAFSKGLTSAAFQFEDFSGDRIGHWLQYNREVAARIQAQKSNLSLEQRLNAEVLQRQIKREFERWEHDKVQANHPIWYAELISQALTYILVGDQLAPHEKARALKKRLQGIDKLCHYAINTLRNGSPERTRRSLQVLERTLAFYQNNLPQLTRDWAGDDKQKQLQTATRNTATRINDLLDHIRQQVLPKATLSDYFGVQAYTRKLQIDVDLTPAQLAARAAQEIDDVRRLMAVEARGWWEDNGKKVPEKSLLTAAITTMEENRVDNREDFLDSFVKLTHAAEAFVIKHDLATVPQPRTLYIGLSPDHFSGAAYGGVYPAGPFNPEADTLFYLPTIPDAAPEQQKAGFYRSFNTHFNTMIIAHEMLPGHYMQYKIAVQQAPPVRALFADGVYVEGWGTFSEKLMLDAGWGGGDRLTRLAHLRKRLENATRAYVSVKVHTENWRKQQLLDFATTRGLLAPQFATNLWHRVINNPLQITTYFLGFHGFKSLWREEQDRLGEKFNTKSLVDAVLAAGPIPIDALGGIVR
ncbi:DUF885 domain-containing protein [Exilibacterium tricleocarpae]|uniref:DUF885 domain-containing protein n=1 Tax=Exilibacterium tricleocarpae TaxID=2591008 RepID=A0A545U4G5_9GAMM|nr:DUF885 family protein [Exilibacterium tricleocarpae]TQV84293.1 DUF885 domain-containing protein [Exilibacterium tricleocarpae]